MSVRPPGVVTVASERKTCAKPNCHRKFSRPLGSRRVYCEDCSPPRKPAAAPPAPAAPELGEIESRVLAELEQAGRAETVEAAIVLRLAREMDTGRATASQLGALAPRLLAARQEALRGVKLQTDRLDEVTARRLAKAAGA